MDNSKAIFKNENIILPILYFIILSYLYLNFIVERYGYQGYSDGFTLLKFYSSLILVFFLALITAFKHDYKGFYIYFILMVIVIPSLIIYMGSDISYNFPLITIIGFTIIKITSDSIKFKFIYPRVKKNYKNLLNLLTIFILISLILMLIFGGIRYANFDISAVYEYRKDAADNLPKIYNYITPIVSQAFIPFGLACAAYQKKWNYYAIFSLCSFSFYVLTSHKAPLFIPIIIGLFYMIGDEKKIVKIFSYLLIFIALISIFEQIYWDEENLFNGWITGLFTTRLLFLPSLLNSKYIEFFQTNNLNFFSDSKITFGLFEQVYSEPIPRVIGEILGGESNANTGWIGSGFSQIGIIGVILYSIIIGLLVAFFNGLSKILSFRFVLSYTAIPLIILITSADLVTAFLTNGIGVLIIFTLFIKK